MTKSLAALLCGALFFSLSPLTGCNDPSPADDDSVGGDDDTSAVNLPPVTFTVVVSINAGPEPSEDWTLEVEDAEVDGWTATVPADGQSHEIIISYEGYLHAPCAVKVVDEGRTLVTVQHHPDYANFWPEVGHGEFPLQDGEELAVPLNVDAGGVWYCTFGNSDPEANEVDMLFGEVGAYFFSELEMSVSGHELVGRAGEVVFEGVMDGSRSEWNGTAHDDFDTWNLHCER